MFNRKLRTPPKPKFEVDEPIYYTSFVTTYEGKFKAVSEEGKYIIEVEGKLFHVYPSGVTKKPQPKLRKKN